MPPDGDLHEAAWLGGVAEIPTDPDEPGRRTVLEVQVLVRAAARAAT